MNPLIESLRIEREERNQRSGTATAESTLPAQRSTAATNNIDPVRVSTLAESILAAADVPKTTGERLQKTLERIKKQKTEQALLKQSSEEKLAAVRDDDEDVPNWKTDPTTEVLGKSSKLLRDALSHLKNEDYTSALPGWKTDPTTGTTESDDEEIDPGKPNEDDRREELSESSKLLRDAINNSKNQDYTSALPGWKRSR